MQCEFFWFGSMIRKEKPLRSEKHRRVIASMSCCMCGMDGYTQAAHANFGKGMGQKACDSLTFPLCHWCHQFLDQGGKLLKDDRRLLEISYVNSTRDLLIRRHQWPDAIEEAYQKAKKWGSHEITC